MKILSALFLSLFFFTSVWAQSLSNLEYAQTKLDERGEFYFTFSCNSPQVIYEMSDVISFDKQVGTQFYAYANQSEFDQFLTYGFDFEPVYSYYNKTRATTMATTVDQMSSWDRYPTYDVYVQMMNNFVTSYPNICSLDTIGTSNDGYKLLSLKISDNIDSDEDEPEFFWTNTMHGDEVVAYVMPLRFIDYLLTNYNIDPQVTNLVNEIEIYVNPLANPDGTFNGSTGGTSVASSQRYNANNKDLNRNFPRLDGTSTSIEVEIQAMMDYATNHDFVMSVNTHSGAECFNYPWDETNSEDGTHPDDTWWDYIGWVYATPTQSASPSDYFTESGAVTEGGDWYVTHGGRQDYMNYFQHCREVTIEWSDTKLLDASDLPDHWNYNKTGMLNYTEQVLYGLRGIVTDACTGIALPDVKVEIASHDEDNSEVYSSAPIGNYHRPIYAGTYDFTYSLDGYQSQTHTVVITNDNSTRLDIELIPDNVATPDFSADQTNVFEGTQVNFTNLTIGTVTAYNWTFDGGSPLSSTFQDTNSTYNTAGSYDVELSITSLGCTISELKENYIVVSAHAAPIADFEASSTTVNVGASVDFTDLSTNFPDTWNWTFDGGTPSSSTDQNPSVVYGTAGFYEVSLSASNDYGSDSEIKSTYITVVESDVLMQNGSITQCGGLFKDSGGDSNYENSESYEFTIYPSTPGAMVKVSFSSFDVEPDDLDCYDDLTIYDGESSSSSQIGAYCGTDYSVIGTNGVVTASGATGALTFVFSSDNYENRSGWEATISCYSPTDPPVAAFSAAETSSCSGEIQFQDESSAPTSWSWDFGDGESSTEQHPLHTYTSDGIYTVQLSVTNDYGTDSITNTDYIIIDMPDSPVVTNAESCGSASLTLSASGDGELYWYDALVDGNELATGTSYSNTFLNTTTVYVENAILAPEYTAGKTDNSGDGSNYIANNEHGLIFNASVAFTLRSVKVYATGSDDRTIKLLDSSDAELASITVNIPDGESRVDLNFEVPVGTGLKLMGPVAPNMYRNGGNSASDLSYPFEVSDVVSITGNTADDLAYYYYFYDWDIKVGDDCLSPRVPVTATIYPVPTVDLGDDQGICSGNNITLDAGSGFTSYTWSNSGVGQSVSVSNSGTYSVEVEDVNGCTANDEIIVTVNPNPTVSFTTSPENDSNGDGSVTALGADASSPYEYIWNSGQNTANVSNLSAGEYCVTVTDQNLCTVTDCVMLSSTSPLPVSSFTADQINACGSLNVQFTDQSTNTPTSWSWNFGDGVTSTEQNPEHNFASAGTYAVSLTVQNADGFDEEVKPNYIHVYDEIQLTETQTELSCFGDDDASFNPVVTGGNEDYSFAWQNNSGTEIGSSQILSGLSVGDYYLTVTDGVGCSASGEFEVIQPEELLVEVQITNETVVDACDGIAVANVSGGTPEYYYNWNGGLNTQTISELCPDDYIVTVTDDNGCTAIANGTVGVTLAADFSANVTEGCEDLIVQFTDESIGGATSWNWTFGDGATSTEQNPEHTYVDPGDYVVGLSVENAISETDVENKIDYIVVLDSPELSVEVTPESDVDAFDGTATVIITGTDNPYDIIWSTGSNDETITGLTGGTYSVEVFGVDGCSATAVATVETNLDYILNSSSVVTNLYPNPTRDILSVESAMQVVNVKVYSVEGRLVKEMNPMSSKFNMEMKDLSGIYIVSLLYKNNETTKYQVVVE